MHPEFIEKLEILKRIKTRPEPIASLNRENLETYSITTESELVHLVVLKYIKSLNFDMVPVR